MRKQITVCLLALVLCLAWCPAAAAEAEEDGICAVSDSTVIADMKTAAGAAVAGAHTEVGGVATDGYYPGAVRFSVTVTGVTAEQEYALYVLTAAAQPTAENIAYINQQKADSGTLVFDNVYPKTMAEGLYRVYVTGADRPFDADAPLATFRYHAVSRCTLTVTVDSRITGQDIQASLTRGGAAVNIDPSAVSDSAAQFVWLELPWGTYQLTLRKAGFTTRTEQLTLSGDTNAALQLVARGDLNGDGASVDGVGGALDMQILYDYLSAGSVGGQLTDPDYFAAVADVNGNGAVNILDYQYLYELVRQAG